MLTYADCTGLQIRAISLRDASECIQVSGIRGCEEEAREQCEEEEAREWVPNRSRGLKESRIGRHRKLNR
jgi:hypothetical protein